MNRPWYTADLAVVCIASVTMTDLIAATAVAIFRDTSPLVLGDVAKVGMGALAGVALGRSQAGLPKDSA